VYQEQLNEWNTSDSIWPNGKLCWQTRLLLYLQFNIRYFFIVNVSPELQTCRLGVENRGGEVANSTSVGPCLQEKSNYVKFQPARLSFEFTFSSEVSVSTPKPLHIAEYQFGIVNSSIGISKRNVSGTWTYSSFLLAHITAKSLNLFDNFLLARLSVFKDVLYTREI
jgi:hypothetical protein